jgi:hypothetical protein
MSSLPIVEDFDIFKNGMQSILMAFISLMINQFGFHYGEKRFGHRIIPTISLARHALYNLMFSEFFSKATTCILDASIRMKNKPLARTTSSDRPFQGSYHHFMAQRAAQRPAAIILFRG